MSANVVWVLGFAAPLFGGLAAAFCARLRCERRKRLARRAAALGGEGRARPGSRVQGRNVRFGLRYAESLTRRIYAGSTTPLSPSARGQTAASTRTGSWFVSQRVAAGCDKDVSASAFCEARLRLGLAGCLACALVGVVFSTELGLIAAAVGAVAGATAPSRAVKAAKRERSACAERHLSEMLEVVSLGLRSGLTFDRSFELYSSHFENDFARACAKAHRSWSLGLMTREEALRRLTEEFECDQLSRVVDSVVRGLKFGTALTDTLGEAAAQSRAAYRTALEEKVAKAPVKMMLPTGTLILPAMLLLVIGPILLELASGF